VIFGLPSSGLHTNGYTLARAALSLSVDPAEATADRRRLERYDEQLGETLADALLRPHLAYVSDLAPALPLVRGLAHVTGGAFEENLPRVLPPGLSALIRKHAWAVPPIFALIQRAGGVEDEEMYRVFNMGIGMVAVVPPEEATNFRSLVPTAIEIGEVVAGTGVRFEA
jgi:phosphoribosylformylglycinamidine cyclo-ligase